MMTATAGSSFGTDSQPLHTSNEPSPSRPPAEQQSYFFIKNDPVVKIVCGNTQSGIICESGRLFVWGRNHFGQLGLGSTEDCFKPSCVRIMKRLKQRVKDVRFGGNGYSLILTEDGKVFYAGKNIFPFNAKVASLTEAGKMKKCSVDNSEYIDVPIELTEFSECLEKEDERIADVSAGFCHFVARTSAGNCIGWGYNSHQQLGGVDSLKILTKPDRLGVEERIELTECGNYCTLMVSQTNRLYLSGKFQKISIPVIRELSEVTLPAKVITIQITRNDVIFLLLHNKQVYRSNRVQKIEDLRFERLELLDNLLRKDEFPAQIAPATNFTSFVTTHGRLLTTYDTDSPFTPTDHFRELVTFKHFTVASAASGLEHSLVQAFPRKFPSPAIDVDFYEAVETIEAAIKSEEEKIRNGTPMPTLTIDRTEEFTQQEKRRLRQERIAQELSKDECIQIETEANDVKFIENGVDITSMVENHDRGLGEAISKRKKQYLNPNHPLQRGMMRDNLELGIAPSPNISQLIDYSDDDNGSISSQSTFDDEDDATDRYVPVKATNRSQNDSNNNKANNRKFSLGSKLESKEKVRKLWKDLKAKSRDVSCRNAGSVLDDDARYTKHSMGNQPAKPPLKVCAVM
ncbi:X-linked retinitis pigmentosa GTPase regulator isoform X2 [Wyeomyia smithii]|nr:X-linked retinitis pigmentosa GTPase regulator isoform X2 [Wyeomyia smithii]